MPRIRTVKPEFWTSEHLGTRLKGPEGRQARLLFIALWNHAEDRTGVLRGSPAFLRGAVFPYDEDVTAADVDRWLGLLEAGGFIARYERQGSRYIWVRGFVKHQKIDRPSSSTLPEPSEQERHPMREPPPLRAQDDSSPRRALVEPSLQERKVVEGSGRDNFPASRGAADADDLPDATDHAEPMEMRPTLTLTPTPASKPQEKPKRQPRAIGEPTGDPRHAPLVDALVKADAEALGRPYAFRGGRDAKAVSECLALADQDPATAGEAAPTEVLRRWGIGRRWRGFPACTSLTDLAANWNAYAQPQDSQPGPPRSDSRAPVRAETQPQYDPNKPAVVIERGRNAL